MQNEQEKVHEENSYMAGDIGCYFYNDKWMGHNAAGKGGDSIPVTEGDHTAGREERISEAKEREGKNKMEKLK